MPAIRPARPAAAAISADAVGHESLSAARGTVPIPGDLQHTDIAADDEWLRLPAVRRMVPLSVNRIYALMTTGQFPRPRPIGSRAVAWSRREIDAWLRGVAVERECRNAGLKTGKRGPLPRAATARNAVTASSRKTSPAASAATA